MAKLTAKQEQFCHEYLIDLNSTQAAIRAGYSKKTANVIGPENLAKPCIAEVIAKLKAQRIEKTQINAQWVLDQAVIMHKKCSQVLPIKDKDGAEVYKFDSPGANKALELVGKHVDIQAFKEVKELTGTLTIGRVLAELEGDTEN